MKQSEAESRRSETRPLNKHNVFDECDTQRESSGAFIMAVNRFRFFRASICEVNSAVFIILDTFESSVIMLLCAVVTCLIKCIKY